MPSDSLVQSVLRSLDILEMVARSESGLTLQDIASALDVASPTAHNLARTLVARGYLQKTPRPVRYRLGAACFDLVQAQAHRDLLRRAGEQVGALGRLFPQASVIFAEAIGAEVVVVVRTAPDRTGVIQHPHHPPLLPYSAAVSLAYQAFCTPGEREAFRAHHAFEESGAHYWGTPQALDAFLAEARRLGYVHLPVGAAAETLRAGAPVFSPPGVLAGMIGLSMSATEAAAAEADEVLRELTAAAARVGSGVASTLTQGAQQHADGGGSEDTGEDAGRRSRGRRLDGPL